VLKSTGWRLPHSLRGLGNNLLVQPIQHDHGARTPHRLIYVSQSTTPAPPPDLPPVVASASKELVPAAGLPPVVPAVVRPHVVPKHTAQMLLFAKAMCKPAQVVQMWVVIILRNACIYMRSDLKSRSGPLTRRSVTWIVLPSLYFFLDLESQKECSVIKLHLFDAE